MILGYALALIGVSVFAALLCLGTAIARRGTNDYTLGVTVLVTLLLVVQIILAVVVSLSGPGPAGDPIEFWLYLIVALVMPPIAGVWALIDRSVTANLVLTVVHASIAVMVYRMIVIWNGGA